MTCVECKKLRYDRMKQIGQEHYEECKQAYQQGRADAIESAYYVIKPFMSLEEWTEEVNRQIELKEQNK